MSERPPSVLLPPIYLRELVSQNTTVQRSAFERVQPAMLEVARRIIPSEADPADVLQVVFEKVVKRVKSGSSIRNNNMAGYLLQATRNASIDVIRKEIRERKKLGGAVVPLEDVWDSRLGTGVDISKEVSEKMIGKDLYEKVSVVITNPRFREVFLLTVYGFDYREIAEKLDMPIGSVKSCLSRARALLKQHAGEIFSAAALKEYLTESKE